MFVFFLAGLDLFHLFSGMVGDHHKHIWGGVIYLTNIFGSRKMCTFFWGAVGVLFNLIFFLFNVSQTKGINFRGKGIETTVWKMAIFHGPIIITLTQKVVLIKIPILIPIFSFYWYWFKCQSTKWQWNRLIHCFLQKRVHYLNYKYKFALKKIFLRHLGVAAVEVSPLSWTLQSLAPSYKKKKVK